MCVCFSLGIGFSPYCKVLGNTGSVIRLSVIVSFETVGDLKNFLKLIKQNINTEIR